MDCEEAVYSNDYYDFIAEHFTGITRGFSEYCTQTISNLYEVVYVEREKVLPVNMTNYPYESIPKCFTLMDRSALEASGILRMQNYPTLELKGKGVLIGFIDTGIDYSNMVFRNIDGSSRIAAIWDQTERSGTPPEDFLYGSEYRTDEINEALNSENPESIVPTEDTNGHGTFIASVAAGSESQEADFIGAAPYAQIAMVKLKEAKEYLREFFFIPEGAVAYQENDIMAGIAYLDKLAEQMNMPLVLCISVGANVGNPGRNIAPLTFQLEMLSLRKSRAVVITAGNEGNERHHFAGEIGVGQEYQNVEVSVGAGVTGFVLEMWSKGPQLFEVEIISPTGGRGPREFSLYGGREYTFLFENALVSVDYRISRVVTGDQLIYIRFTRPVQGIWNIRVYPRTPNTEDYHMWLPVQGMLTGEVYFIRSNPDTTITSPGNARLPMTVTAYNIKDNSIYINAGRGYLADGTVKPDFAAPGVDVYGAGLRNQFVRRSGTSIAAAITAGAVALIMEWAIVRGNSTLISGIDIKNAIIRGADQEAGRTYPNRVWGYGRLNLYQGFENYRES